MRRRVANMVCLAGLVAALAGGCTGAEEASVPGTFVFDFLRGALAAFVL